MSKLTEQQKQELALLANLADDSIDTSDIPEQTEWSDVQRGKFYRPVKQSVTIRLDADIIAWFKAQEGKYQSNINQALREYIKEH